MSGTVTIVVNWAVAAWNYFWNHGGTATERARQEGIVRTFATKTVKNAASAEITAPGHTGGTDPSEPWHITTRYYDANNKQISSPKGGAWHVYP